MTRDEAKRMIEDLRRFVSEMPTSHYQIFNSAETQLQDYSYLSLTVGSDLEQLHAHYYK